MLSISFTSPNGKIGSTYEHRVPLTGTGPFSVGEYFLPDGWTAEIIGTTLVFTGMAREVSAGFDASFEIFSCYGCDPVTFTTSIVINSGCVYSWSMIPTIAPVGTPVKTTFTPSKGCPADAVLRLAVFRADGVTPYIDTAISADPLVITIAAGSSTYTIQPSDANADLIFKPDAEQSACLLTCTPSNLRQRRIVPPRTDCFITWAFSSYQFAAGKPGAQTYTVRGLPKGGLAAFDLYVGNVLQDYGDFVLSYDSPSYTAPLYTFPVSAIGIDFNYRPRTPLLGTAVGCNILPLRRDFDVVTGSVCAINWTIETSSFIAATPTAQTYSATGIPVGGAVAFDLFVDDTLQTYGSFQLTADNPSYSPGKLTFPPAAAGTNFNYRPRTPSLGTAAACLVTPNKAPFAVTALICAINWKLENDVFSANIPKRQTYSSTGIPKGGSVAFDLYVGNVLQDYGSFELTYDMPSLPPITLTFPPFAIGVDLNYRPRAPSKGNAVSCSVTPAKQSFRVIPGIDNPVVPTCAINWTMQTTAFTAGTAAQQKFTATGMVPGSSMVLKLYDNGVVQSYGEVTLSYGYPTYTPPLLTFPAGAIGHTYSYQPVLPLGGTGASCSVTPSVMAFTVQATAAGACGGVMAATAGGCLASPPPPPPAVGGAMCSTLGTCTVSGGTVSVEFRANNVPIGTAITFETSSDSGATWGVSTTVTCSNSISQYVGLLGVAGVCPGFTAAAGVFTCVSNATIRARMKVASAVIPNCI